MPRLISYEIRKNSNEYAQHLSSQNKSVWSLNKNMAIFTVSQKDKPPQNSNRTCQENKRKKKVFSLIYSSEK